MIISVATLAMCLVAVSGESLLAKQPNIIYIMADDLGWAGVSWHDDSMVTPVMAGLVKDGIELNQAYVQNQCTPSRYAFNTGRYPFHGGMQHGVIKVTQAECAPLEQDFVSNALKEIGYDTHLVGKWHLGFCDDACTPLQRGFDTFFGFFQAMIHHYDHTFGFGSLMGHDFKNGSEIYTNTGIHETVLETARTVEIIENHDTDAPFFISLMYGAPHQPYQCDDKWAAKYPDITDKEEVCYKAMITEIDDSVGQIVEMLKKTGHYENTILVLQADNGGEAPIALNTPLRGGKFSLFEGGVKAASWAHSPLFKKKGYKAEQLIHVSDWYPTFVALAGGSTKGKNLDGVDQSDFLINGGASARTEIIHNIDVMLPQQQGHRAIRVGDFKLIEGYPGEVDGYGVNMFHHYHQCHWDLPEYGNSEDKKRAASYFPSAEELAKEEACITSSINDLRLYNIKEDPTEKNNLAASMPELAQELSDKMKEAEKTLIKIPSSNEMAPMTGHPKYWGDEWLPGWCRGVPQKNVPIEDAE